MKRIQHLVQTSNLDYARLESRLYQAIEYLNNGRPEDAQQEILEAFRFTERTQTSFKELVLLVKVVLNTLREVEEQTDSAVPYLEPPSEDSFVALLERLRAKYEDIPY